MRSNGMQVQLASSNSGMCVMVNTVPTTHLHRHALPGLSQQPVLFGAQDAVQRAQPSTDLFHLQSTPQFVQPERNATLTHNTCSKILTCPQKAAA